MHVLAGPDGFERHRRVQMGRSGDIDDVEIGLIEHIAIVGVDLLDAVFLGKAQSPRLVEVANSHNRGPWVAQIAL